MERLKRVLSGMIALTMTASFAACGNDDNPSSADGAGGAASTEADTTTTTVGTINEKELSKETG